jgi:hypothetical protein
MVELFLKAAETFGPIAVACAFFIWWSFRREQDLTNRLREVEDYVRDALMKALAETQVNINHNSEVLEATNAILRETTTALSKFPCLQPGFKDAVCSLASDRKKVVA